jgi:hypothetical protein
VGPSGAGGKGRAISASRDVLTGAIPEAELEQPGSPEGCIDALKSKPQVVFYDEFGEFLSRTQNGQLAGLRMIYTNLYDCVKQGRLLVQRQGKKKASPAEQPRLSILGGVTPSLLEEFTSRVDWEGGFMSRFFMIHATGERTPPTQYQGQDMKAKLAEKIASFAKFTVEVEAKGNLFEGGPSIGECAGWSNEAAQVWEAWIQELEERRSQEPILCGGGIHRTAAYTAKIALLLCWEKGIPQGGAPWAIPVGALYRAREIARLHVDSLSEVAGDLVFDRDLRDERDLLRATSPLPVTLGEAIRKSGLTLRRGREALGSLLEKGRIVLKVDLDGRPKYVSKDRENVILFPGPITEPNTLFE